MIKLFYHFSPLPIAQGKNTNVYKYKFNTGSINDKSMGQETTVYFSTKHISVAEIRSLVHH